MNYTHIAKRALNAPLFLEPGYARVFFGALSRNLNIETLVDADGRVETGEKLRVRAAGWTSSRERDRPYQVVDGVAVLPISGTLVHKHGYMRPYSGMTGYDGIIGRLDDAMNDPEVKGVLFDIDSPGGEVTGCFDCADQMASYRGKKPMWSLCYDMACSAAMALSSAADLRLITQTGIAGSIGVIMAHASYEAHLKEQGVNVTLIHSGARKADGNPYQNLSNEVFERFQDETHQLRNDFSELVARNIGISPKAILGTEAATYRGQAAIDIGLADQLINGNQALNHFIDYLSSRGGSNYATGATMTQQETQPQDRPETSGKKLNVENATAEARMDERQRISAILNHAEAEGRTSLAQHLAFSTSMSVDDAAAMLKASSKAVAESGESNQQNSPLDRHMATVAQAEIGPDGESTPENDEPDMVAQALSAYTAATGEKIGA